MSKITIPGNSILLLEGGSLRGLYTAGVLDTFMENDLYFPAVAYQEYETKNAHETTQAQKENARALMALVAAFGHIQTKDPADPAVQAQVQKLQAFITEHYYTCTKEILHSLGQMYGAGGEFTANINAAGGPGAAEFARKAIERYCCG